MRAVTRDERRKRRRNFAIARKDRRRVEMALKLVRFPAVKPGDFDFAGQPSIDSSQIRDLAASRWIADGENVLLQRRSSRSHASGKAMMVGTHGSYA